jgi:hypothetical protein
MSYMYNSFLSTRENEKNAAAALASEKTKKRGGGCFWTLVQGALLIGALWFLGLAILASSPEIAQIAGF